EITNICNLRCSFCPPSGREPEFMDEKLFTEILDKIKESSEYIYFHVKGEPLMHPQIEKFLDISHEKGFRVSIATNGTLIGETGEKLLDKPALRQISFSLHSLEGESNRDIIGKYLDDIFSFALEAVKKTKMFIEFKLWNLNRENELNRIIYEHMENRFNLDGKVSDMVPSGKGIRILDRIFLNRGNEFLWPDLDSPENNPNGYCYGLKRQAAILVDGTVVPCCLDGKGIMKLGNITDSSFSDIINSKRALRIIRGFSERKAVEEMCRKCTYRDRFGF
ncbi:MAG TPA: radical SAM/SPASM domain-containing protein, partial [Spirochaetota bacterium]|nr:radical SAM/SPASM domain-containing protein [Spirochaetota bacterium]